MGADPTRIGFSVQNQSTSTIKVELIYGIVGGVDRGSTMYALGPAGADGQQGGSITSTQIGNHLGQLRVYGVNGTAVAIRTW